ncbi:MAG TPA: DUF4474 domain-containing protein [Oscillospiraceae bacterium]|nr:DUF4474 domain-containing protein [Oscillospiraceae bacterium]
MTTMPGQKSNQGTGNAGIDHAFAKVGYVYDQQQKIFFSHRQAWQRDYGYCQLYDEMLAPLSMIIDCEPIYFNYEQRRWMIEFWKGQYALTTGCEVGVYYTEAENINIPGVFNGPFYNCVGDADLLDMSCTLYKDGKKLFTRADKHWWLTGFILGEFSDPTDLTLDVSITLKDEAMLAAFLEGLRSTGYQEDEYKITERSVSLTLAKPRTAQPITRTPEIERIMQWKNKLLCDLYQSITNNITSVIERMEFIKENAPDLYEEIMRMGKNKQLFGQFNLNLPLDS